MGAMRKSGRPTTRELCDFLDRYGEMNAPIVHEDSVQDDPQVQHSGSVWERSGGHVGLVREARPAPRFSLTPIPQPCGAPLLGEHTSQVLLQDLGYTEDRVVELQTAGVLGPEINLENGLTSRSHYAVQESVARRSRL